MHLAELPALLGEFHGLCGTIDQLHGNGYHRLQLLGAVPHQQHLQKQQQQ